MELSFRIGFFSFRNKYLHELSCKDMWIKKEIINAYIQDTIIIIIGLYVFIEVAGTHSKI